MKTKQFKNNFLGILQNEATSTTRRNKILSLLDREAAMGAKIDQDFFGNLEDKFEEDHMDQIRVAIEIFMATQNQTKKAKEKTINSMMKRRQALEAKLFKMKYARLLKLIA